MLPMPAVISGFIVGRSAAFLHFLYLPQSFLSWWSQWMNRKSSKHFQYLRLNGQKFQRIGVTLNAGRPDRYGVRSGYVLPDSVGALYQVPLQVVRVFRLPLNEHEHQVNAPQCRVKPSSRHRRCGGAPRQRGTRRQPVRSLPSAYLNGL